MLRADPASAAAMITRESMPLAGGFQGGASVRPTGAAAGGSAAAGGGAASTAGEALSDASGGASGARAGAASTGEGVPVASAIMPPSPERKSFVPQAAREGSGPGTARRAGACDIQRAGRG